MAITDAEELEPVRQLLMNDIHVLVDFYDFAIAPSLCSDINGVLLDVNFGHLHLLKLLRWAAIGVLLVAVLPPVNRSGVLWLLHFQLLADAWKLEQLS